MSNQERQTLESWVRSHKIEKRLEERARIILLAAGGDQSKDIAVRLNMRQATVSKWRNRFYEHRLSGLHDAPRKGAPARYDAKTKQRILKALDKKPPEGYSSWDGTLLSKYLGDVSPQHIWRVLRKHGIHLQRRHSGV